MNWKLAFSQKIGGVPVMYIGAAIVVVLAVLITRMKDKESSAPESDLTTEEDASTTADEVATAEYGFAATRGTVTVEQSGQPETTAAVTDTNDLWVKRASEFIGSQGTYSTNQAYSALSKYVAGQDLSSTDGKIRDIAIAKYGLPPELSFTPGSTAAAVAKRVGNPPVTHVVKGSSDNTFTELAKLYYPGRNQNQAIDLLQVKNLSLGSQGPWSVGTRVTIPKWTDPVYFSARKGYTTAEKIASRNGVSDTVLKQLNDGMKFPVKIGTKVRIR